MKRAIFLLLGWLCLSPSGVHAGGWIAYVAPDFPQTRALFAELERLARPDLSRHGLELRFVTVPDDDSPEVEQRVMQAMESRPLAMVVMAENLAFAAKKGPSTIPVVFCTRANPVKSGLVESLARPGGNLTGLTWDVEIERKQLELLRELAPAARVFGVIDDGVWMREQVTRPQLEDYERSLSVRLHVVRIEKPSDLARMIASSAAAVDGWLVPINNLTGNARQQVVEAVNATGKPALYGRDFFVESGGLASYQEVMVEPMAQVRDILRLIIAGDHPSRIPVRRPKDFIFALNLDTARDAGIRVPPSIVRRADRVIQRKRLP